MRVILLLCTVFSLLIIRWSIMGVQTTWPPLLILTSVQSVLMLWLSIASFTKPEYGKTKD